MPDPWLAVLERLDDAAKLTGVDPDIHRLLRTPRRVLEVAVPVRMDDGRIEVFRQPLGLVAPGRVRGRPRTGGRGDRGTRPVPITLRG